MAEKRVIELEVKENFKKVEKDIDSLNQSLKETADTTKDVNKTFSDVYGELQPLTSRMGEAEDRLYELAAAGETASKEYKDLLKTVADYRKVQINTDIVVDAASSTMSTKMTNAIGGVANAFSVAEGASALMGVESEKLQETMVKLQAAMAISQGIQGLKEGGLAFKQMGTSAMNALKGIKTGLAATGIGLFVVALGAIVVYWDDIKAAVSGVSSEQAKLNELSHANFETSKEQLSNLDAQDNVLKLQGKSEREILNLKIAKVNTAIELGKIELKNVLATSRAEEAAAIQNYNMTKKIVDFVLDIALYVPKLMTVPIDLAIAGANKISEALGFGKVIALDMGKTLEGLKDKASAFVAGSIFNVPELKKENALAAKEIEKSIAELENQQAGFKLSIKEIDKAAAQTAVDTQKEQNDKLKEYYDALEQERQSQITDAKEKELQEIDNKYEQLYEKADAANQSDKELIAKHQEEVTALNEKYAKQQAEALLKAKEEANKLRKQQEAEFQAEIEQIDEANFQAGLQKTMTEDEYALELVRQKYFALEEAAKGNAEQLAIIETAKALEIEAIDKKSKEKQVLAENELRQKKLQLAGQAFTAIADIMGSFTAKNDKDARKQFQIQKAFNLSAAVVNTAMAVTGALTAGGNPIKLATGMQFVEAGIAAATGAASIVKIASSKFGSGSSGGGGGSSAPTAAAPVMAPNFNVIGSSGVNQLAQIQQQPTRAYVVSGDVATGLSLERNRLQNASF